MRRTRPPTSTATTAVAAVGLLVLVLTGCGGSSDAKTPSAGAAATVSTSTSQRPSASATPSAAPSAQRQTQPQAQPPTPIPGGNGVERLSAAEVITQANAAVRLSKSVHVKGTFTTGGSPVTLDIIASRDGTGRGRVGSNGLTFSIIRKGRSVYFMGDAGFNALLGPSAAKIKGKWIKVVATDIRYSGLADFTDLDGFISKVVGGQSKGTSYTLGSQTDVSGRPTVGVIGTGGVSAATVYISLVGKPYPLRADPPKAEATGSMLFFDWDKPVTVELPRSSTVVDLAKL